MEMDNIEYNIGDTVICKNRVEFSDNTSDEVNDLITITENTVAYFKHSVNKVNYGLVTRSKLNLKELTSCYNEKFGTFVSTIKPRPTSSELQLLAIYTKYLISNDETIIPGFNN